MYCRIAFTHHPEDGFDDSNLDDDLPPSGAPAAAVPAPGRALAPAAPPHAPVALAASPAPPAAAPLGKPTWQPGDPRFGPPVDVKWHANAAAISLTFRADALQRAFVGKGDEAARRRAVEMARNDPYVSRWLDVTAEVDAHRRTSALARARVNELAATRQRLVLEGTGGNLAGRLQEIDQEIAAAEAEVSRADQLVRLALEAVNNRKGEARREVERCYGFALGEESLHLRGREAELLAEIAERCGHLLTELATLQSSGNSVAVAIRTERGAAVERLLTQLQRDGVQQVEAAPAA
jgi:hypothetical protein